MRKVNYFYRRWFFIVLLIIFADQLSKYWAVQSLSTRVACYVMPFMNWSLVFNHGAAFGFLAQQPGWQIYLFALITVLVTCVLFFLVHTGRIVRWGADACFMVIAGGISNMVDRIYWDGAVVDFVQWHFHSFVWPSFNFADFSITVGAILLVVYSQWGLNGRHRKG